MAKPRSLSAIATRAVPTAWVALCLGVTNSRGWALKRLLPSSSACRPVRVPSASTPPIIAEVCCAASSILATPQATITALARMYTALQALVIAESGPKAATASRSLVISTSSSALALAVRPGVKVSTRPMIEDDGKAMVRAPVSTFVTVTP
ncbi:hypothetical protein D3C77_488060 [compost metagenome]